MYDERPGSSFMEEILFGALCVLEPASDLCFLGLELLDPGPHDRWQVALRALKRAEDLDPSRLEQLLLAILTPSRPNRDFKEYA